jgi:hypothetical protein
MRSAKLNANESASLLAQHYQESFSIIRQLEKERNRLFVYLVSGIALIYLVLFESIQLVKLVSGLSERLFGAEFSITLNILQTFLCAILLWLTMRYFQVTIHIERQYNYLHEMEDLLNSFFPGTKAFTREGKSYLEKYPAFSCLIWVFYTWLFPVLMVIVITIRGIIEWTIAEVGLVQHIIDSVIYTAIIITVVLYLLCVHRKK